MFKSSHSFFVPLIVLILGISTGAQAQLIRLRNHHVIIKVNGYAGNYSVKDKDYEGNVRFVSGDTTFEVSRKTAYSINNGAGVGSPIQPFNSFIWFYVDDEGEVTGIEPEGAATLKDSTIEFQTATVNIDAGEFTGQYKLSCFENTARNLPVGFSVGSKTFTAIKNLTYSIRPSGNCRCGDLGLQRNLIYFNVDVDGNVVSLNPGALRSDKNTATFVTKTFSIDSAQNLCKQYKLFYINGYNTEPMIKPLSVGNKSVLHIICGTATCLHANDPEGIKCMCWFPK